MAVHKMADGTKIVGLSHLADGRWRCGGPEKYTFTEPDERLAVARFRAWQERKFGGAAVGQPILHHDEQAAAADYEARKVAGANPHMLASTAGGFGNIVRLVSDDALSEAQWVWLREQFFARPQWVAQRVGIEQLGYLPDLKKPEPSPTLAEVGQFYLASDVSYKWKAKSRAAW